MHNITNLHYVELENDNMKEEALARGRRERKKERTWER
jgi:hypothetical protein